MKRKLTKIIAGIFLLGLMIVPTVTAGLQAPILSTLSFSHQHSGPAHDFTYRHIQWRGTRSAPTAGATGVNISVALVPGSVHGAPEFDYRNIPRNGSNHATFNNANAGRYHFRFTKSNDGITVTSNNVVIQSSSSQWP